MRTVTERWECDWKELIYNQVTQSWNVATEHSRRAPRCPVVFRRVRKIAKNNY
jgi:hypothetical protein